MGWQRRCAIAVPLPVWPIKHGMHVLVPRAENTTQAQHWHYRLRVGCSMAVLYWGDSTNLTCLTNYSMKRW